LVAQVPYGPHLSCRLFPEDVNLNQLRRADQLTRGVLPILVCLSVIKQPLRGGLGPLGLSSHEREKKVASVKEIQEQHPETSTTILQNRTWKNKRCHSGGTNAERDYLQG